MKTLQIYKKEHVANNIPGKINYIYYIHGILNLCGRM